MAARAPFFALEELLFRKTIGRQSVDSGPYFVIGHWRSGTTFLHNLLAADGRFGILDTSHMAMPNDMLLGQHLPLIPSLLKRNLPKTRGIDNVQISPNTPQEEEITLGILSGISYYNSYYFPDRFDEFFDQAIAPEKLADIERERFSKAYRVLVGKLSYIHGGKALLFKNPSSTARILFLKALFPKAKFIHIRRNPYSVFSSSLARLPRMIRAFQLRTGKPIDHEGHVIHSYRKLMQSYLVQRNAVPTEDLIEVSFEEMATNPSAVLTNIYDHFKLPHAGADFSTLDRMVQPNEGYCRNKHSITSEQKERVEREWAFAFNEWDYSFPDGLELIDRVPEINHA